MTRRSFVKIGALAGGTAMLAGLSACGGQSPSAEPAGQAERSSSSASASSSSSISASSSAEAASSASGAAAGAAPAVYFARAVSPEALQAVFDAVGAGLAGNVDAKLSTGEPGGDHYLKAGLISGLVNAVGATIVECNTAYDVASESGTCDTPKNMPHDELPDRIKRIKAKCRINR